MLNSLDLRERLLQNGVQSLSDIELLAIFISSGNNQKSCVDLAYQLLKQLGSIRAVVNANLTTFSQIHGLGVVRYAQLQAAKELFRRNDIRPLKKLNQLTCSEQTHAYLKRQLRDEKNEVFACIFLDSQHRIITYETLFKDSINSTTIHIRPIIEKIIGHNAAAIIIAHNHPSGVSDASAEDFAITEKIQQAIAYLDTKLLDHLVIGDNEVFSIGQEQKWLC